MQWKDKSHENSEEAWKIVKAGLADPHTHLSTLFPIYAIIMVFLKTGRSVASIQTRVGEANTATGEEARDSRR